MPLKQLRELGGRPLIGWSLETLISAGCAPIVVTLPSHELPRDPAEFGDPERIVVVEGGRSRQGSVANGLPHIASELVVVHDAARPFADAELIRRLLEALDGADAAIPAIPLEDTLKETDAGRVVRTVDRTALWRAQTPQVFRTAALRSAHERAALDGQTTATDDAQLIERDGGSVVIIEGSRLNIKLTYPEDFQIAELIAERWR